jgi:hypothetical protein
MRIEDLKRFRGRNPRGYFEDLSWEERQKAYGWLDKFMRRRKARYGHVSPWLFAIYVGQAKRLARMSPEELSTWGRRSLAKRGGYAVQRRYASEGKVGRTHPAHLAAAVSASRRRWKKSVEERRRLGIAPRRSSVNLSGI